jgi:hypothetical protein
MDHFDEGLWAAILRHPHTDLDAAAPDEVIAAFEADLGFRLPPAHRAFLRRANGGQVGALLFFGVGRGDALDLCRVGSLAQSTTIRPVVPFAKNWGGDYYCYDLWRSASSGDYAVLYWNHECFEERARRRELWSPDAPDFLAFLRQVVGETPAEDGASTDELRHELEWDAQMDPVRMLALVRERASPLPLRLFAARCARRVLPLLHDYEWPEPDWGRHVAPALDAVERFLAGVATKDDLAAADFAAFDACEDYVAWTVTLALAACRAEGEEVWRAAKNAASLATDAVGMDAYHRNIEEHGQRESEGPLRILIPNKPGNENAVRAAEEAAQTADLRELFGNPFRPAITSPAWLTPTVVTLARVIAQERRYGDLPVLGDALAEAGCDDPMLLDHCRRPEGHGQGCWVLERLAGGA